jgi:hypothetical protein
LLHNWLIGSSEQGRPGLDTGITFADGQHRRRNQGQRPMRIPIQVCVRHDARRVGVASVVVDAGANIEQPCCARRCQTSFGCQPGRDGRKQPLDERRPTFRAAVVPQIEACPHGGYRGALHFVYRRGPVGDGSQRNPLPQTITGDRQLGRQQAVHDCLDDERSAHNRVRSIAIQARHPGTVARELTRQQ